LLLLAGDVAWAQDPASAIASVDGEVITSLELNQTIGANIAALEERIYQLKRERMDALINERLTQREAARRGITVTALLEAEVFSKIEPVGDSEVESFYQANRSRLQDQESDLRERIRAHLHDQKSAARQAAFVADLRAKSNVTIRLQAPPVYRVDLHFNGAPSRGAADAPVIIVKFEDFHCPFCKESQQTLSELLARYQGKVRVVHKDYPIDVLHPAARGAHVAARCANEQEKFWAYHDVLYANAPKGAPADLVGYAKQVGLNVEAFEQCLASGKYDAPVQSDFDDGTNAGVTGTPAFFINGRLIAGAQPLERFIQVIDEELAVKP
jgi:protein-disulfide isomerase